MTCKYDVVVIDGGLTGDQDWMLNMTPQVKDIVKLNPEFLRLCILPNAGHHLYIDNAPEFNQLVVETLEGGAHQAGP